MIVDDSVLVKYNGIGDEFKNKLNIKLHSMSFYDENYIKTKVKEFNCVVNTNFWGSNVPKEGVHHTCIACISIDCVIKKNYPQVYLDEYKDKIKYKRYLDL